MSSHSIFTVPTGTTLPSAMACSDSPCVVPVGDFEIFALGPGAEAPGWPYVVPVGDIGRKANYNVVLNHFAAVTVFAGDTTDFEKGIQLTELVTRDYDHQTLRRRSDIVPVRGHV